MELVALDDYLASPDWGLNEEDRADLIEPIWQLGEAGGLQYGVPAEIMGHFLIYNLTWGLGAGFQCSPQEPRGFSVADLQG